MVPPFPVQSRYDPFTIATLNFHMFKHNPRLRSTAPLRPVFPDRAGSAAGTRRATARSGSTAIPKLELHMYT